jgi:phage shock protein C
MKKLTRSQTDNVIGGVLGGFAEYITVDPTVVRLGYVLITLFSCFAGVLFYIIAWIIIPMKVSHIPAHADETKNHEKHTDHESEKEISEEKSDVSHETKKEN